MPRRTVQFEAGQFYHLYNRGCNREPIFASPKHYIEFLGKLRKYLVPDAAKLIAYCLMPNHYHLLIQLLKDDLAAAMHRLGISYSKSINLQESRVGPLFQGPFQAIHIDDDSYLLELTRYIHCNPLKAGLVHHLEDWPYSSCPEYVGLREGTLPEPTMILEMIGSRERYREFVHRRDHESPKDFEIFLPEEDG